jgi:hypothetical protein
MTMSRHAKTEWQRRKRAAVASASGRQPHRPGRPPTGRQAQKHHGDRRAQRVRARARLLQRTGDNGWCVTRHPILEEAIIVARRHAKPDRGSVIFDPLFEEAVSVAALAICAGDDPEQAARAFVRSERARAYRTAPLLADVA